MLQATSHASLSIQSSKLFPSDQESEHYQSPSTINCHLTATRLSVSKATIPSLELTDPPPPYYYPACPLGCSVTCGTGVKQRPFWCQHEDKYVDRRYCENDNIPISKDVCKPGDCFEWIVGPWEQCPVKCGNGTTHRVISCRSSSLQKVDESFCSSLTRPSSSKSCSSGQSCSNSVIRKKNPLQNRFKEWKPPHLRTLSDTNSIPEFNRAIWKEGSWSKCTSLCGEGVRRRTVTCHDSNDDSRLSLSYCDSKRKPKTTEKCIGRQCTHWETGEWSECSCDSKTRKRKVSCVIEKNKFGENECNVVDKPHSLEDCECPHKIHFHHEDTFSEWKTGPWAEAGLS
ncbi:a disintegrin and metalloproteinase with thrombospondin motifs 9 [Trichonephila inaurata madagascariensis]|uniref:A disintegrin and metalloproteinase with thrombospondin motifs 9 n=1 Tax=Trichonephila inaurata madagascariensis TaxID=2747483 RepID=A0A8X7CDX8_9ARAC|nr:a disintegrin and metalloproteinase with thrombospondin motifs 9 [Trichonephila inaurata madagascariensis]